MGGNAVYFDGDSSARHDVTAALEGVLVLRGADGHVLARWDYGEIRREDSKPGRLRLSNRSANPLARLDTDDEMLIGAIAHACPDLDRRRRGGGRHKVAFWSLAAAASALIVAWLGVPLLAVQLARLVPPAQERELGDAVDDQLRDMLGILSKQDLACDSDPAHHEAQAVLDALVNKLSNDMPQAMAPRIAVLRTPIPNAVALPGGQIYVFAPLLGQLATSDELAGVLAHEMGHVVHRHGLRRFFEEAGLALMFGYVIGDFAGGTVALAASRFLAGAAYSRDMERVADSHAAQVMARLGRDPAALASALQRIAPPDPGDQRFAFLRSHPLTDERADFLRAKRQGATAAPLMAQAEWELLRGYCAHDNAKPGQ